MAPKSQPTKLQISAEDDAQTFNMSSLRIHLPKKRGLSKYFSGKTQSFTCILDVKSVDDLEKPEYPCLKKRQKHSSNQSPSLPPSCRLVLIEPCRPCVLDPR